MNQNMITRTMPDATITLTRYAEPNWLFLETLVSIREQVNSVLQVLVLDQQDDKNIKDFCFKYSTQIVQFIYIVIPAKSLSYARNEAIRLCTTELLFYIDTDAVAEPNWAIELITAMNANNAAIAGGKIIPKWHKSPGFLQRSGLILEQYSMLDLGDEVVRVKKVIGASFAINLKLLSSLAHFDEELGRQNGKLLGGEETQMCADAIQKGLSVIYVGTAAVHHQVMPERVSFRWIAKRMYYGGYSRALRGGKPEPNNEASKFTHWDYLALMFLLPFYIAGFARVKLVNRGDND
jgi:glycosyltransferase involved in cell wall biosynthesis